MQCWGCRRCRLLRGIFLVLLLLTPTFPKNVSVYFYFLRCWFSLLSSLCLSSVLLHIMSVCLRAAWKLFPTGCDWSGGHLVRLLAGLACTVSRATKNSNNNPNYFSPPAKQTKVVFFISFRLKTKSPSTLFQHMKSHCSLMSWITTCPVLKIESQHGGRCLSDHR